MAIASEDSMCLSCHEPAGQLTICNERGEQQHLLAVSRLGRGRRRGFSGATRVSPARPFASPAAFAALSPVCPTSALRRRGGMAGRASGLAGGRQNALFAPPLPVGPPDGTQVQLSFATMLMRSPMHSLSLLGR
jgi:hypothetical protein